MSNMTPRTINRWEPSPKRGPRHCDFGNCIRATRERKPFCPDHVEENPYVQDVLAIISERKKEERNVGRKGWRAVDVEGSIAQEILNFLKIHGERTYARVARDLGRDATVTASYLVALHEREMVIVGRSTRGSLTVQAA